MQLAMPAIYAELHKPQSRLQHKRGIELVQLHQNPRRDIDAAYRMVLDGDLRRQIRDRTPTRKVDGQ